MTGEQQISADPSATRGLPPVEEREWRHVVWDISDSGVMSITMNRPERLNALNYRLLREMHQLIQHARETQEVRVVTLRGEGTRAFCSGDDLRGMEPEPGVDSSQTVHHPLLLALRDLPKPVVALIRGWALGHGFELANACDFRLGADNVEVGDHRVTRAIAPNGGSTWFLPRIVGQARALELLMTGRHLYAEEALEWGLINRVVPDAELAAAAGELATCLAQGATLALGEAKRLIQQGFTETLESQMERETRAIADMARTEDAHEGIAAFIAKRKPDFKGR